MFVKTYKNFAKRNLRGQTLRAFRIEMLCASTAILSAAAAYYISQQYSRLTAILMQGVLLAVTAAALGGLRQGASAWYLRAAHNRPTSSLLILYWLQRRRGYRAAALRLAVRVRKLFYMIALTAPAFVLLYLLPKNADTLSDARTYSAVILGSILYAVTGAVCAWVIAQKYALSECILAEHPDITIREAIRKSTERMNGRCIKLLVLKVSFIPALIPCAAIIPILYYLPYYRQTVACMLCDLLTEDSIIESVDAAEKPGSGS